MDPVGLLPRERAEETGVRGELQEREGWNFLRVDSVGDRAEPFPREFGRWLKIGGGAGRPALGVYRGVNEHGYAVFFPTLYTEDSPILGPDGKPFMAYRFAESRPFYLARGDMRMVGPPCNHDAENAIKRKYGDDGLDQKISLARPRATKQPVVMNGIAG
ncbi:MAG: hypothetical protein ABIH92_05930 [Nanoarchaeota archaeon]